jgi:acyl-CoA thioesterase I
MRCLTVLFLLIALPAVAAGSPDSQSCDIAPQFVKAQKLLGPLKAAIAAGGPVEILAVGSGATTGANGDSPDTAYPYRMLDALRAAVPRVSFDLTVRGGRGMSAAEMLPLVKAQIQQAPVQLVLWQTGTVEAIRGMRADRMRQALREGLEVIRAAGGSLVLLDPQFTRALRANTDVEPYETELQQVAALPDAALFHRYELTRLWALGGKIDPERATKDTREAELARLNMCLGQALAGYVLSGAGVATP